ncbi:thioredoxin domain-containing protein [Rhizobium sp. RCAM05350]|nr:thioredoxin domain-containing protein [Rhizobium sp. RCAM05350]
MSGNDNPYAASYGNQMTATASYGTAPAQVPPAAAAATPAGELIKETTTANFTRDVLEASRQQPVLVDFWAPLVRPVQAADTGDRKVVTEAQGRVRLVKMNIDDHPSIAGQLGIQSIPAVIAFVGGRPVDGFMGAVPESQIREFIDKIAGPMVDDQQAGIDAALAEAKAFAEQGDIENAAGLFGAVLQADPENAAALAGLSNCLITAGELEQARSAGRSLRRACQGCRHRRRPEEARPDRGSPQARRPQRAGANPCGRSRRSRRTHQARQDLAMSRATARPPPITCSR